MSQFGWWYTNYAISNHHIRFILESIIELSEGYLSVASSAIENQRQKAAKGSVNGEKVFLWQNRHPLKICK